MWVVIISPEASKTPFCFWTSSTYCAETLTGFCKSTAQQVSFSVRAGFFQLFPSSTVSPEALFQKSVSLSPATVTEMLDKLEASGFVERKKDGSDSRRLQVYITDRGRVAATEMEAERIRAVSELFAVLSPDEVSELERLVSKLNGSLHGVEPPAPQPRNTSEFYGLSVKSVRGPLTRSRPDKIRGGIRLR